MFEVIKGFVIFVAQLADPWYQMPFVQDNDRKSKPETAAPAKLA